MPTTCLDDSQRTIPHFDRTIEEVYSGVTDGPVLGIGINGQVRKVRHRETGHEYALKVLDLERMKKPSQIDQFREEIDVMCELDHPNIVRLEEVYESATQFYMVQELCTGGELFDGLEDEPMCCYSEERCGRIIKQITSAVAYIHSKGIVHRDLKLENFLFDIPGLKGELKMIDFGLSKHLHFNEEQHDPVGTPYTVAPEVIKGAYDARCDVWAIGVITYMLLCGDPPFGGCGGPETLREIRDNILAGRYDFGPDPIWNNVSEMAKEFICTLLVTDPKDRPTSMECLFLPWLEQWSDEYDDDGGDGGRCCLLGWIEDILLRNRKKDDDNLILY